mgnify:CR=1 FL=1
MKVATTIRFISFIYLTALCTFNVYAYDGDVDYSAPYVTVDPETGKLVTIDPKAQTKTPHTTPGSSTTSGNENNNNAIESNPTSTSAMGQATTTTIQPQTSETQNTNSNLLILFGILLVGFVTAFIYRNKKETSSRKLTEDQHPQE